MGLGDDGERRMRCLKGRERRDRTGKGERRDPGSGGPHQSGGLRWEEV